MSTILEKVRLICSDADENSNKIWEGYLYDNGDVETRWGRVRDALTLQSKMFPNAGKGFLEKKKHEKAKKGYTEVKTVDTTTSTTSTTTVDTQSLSAIVKRQLLKDKSSDSLTKIIDKLVRANIHRITSSTSIKYNDATGLFTTPLGIVTPDAISDARDMLVEIKANLNKEEKLKKLASLYLRLVPRDIGVKFNVKAIFPDDNSIKKENDILDSLEASFNSISAQKPSTVSTLAPAEEQLFNVNFDVMDRANKEWKRIFDWFVKSNKAMHGYRGVKLNDIYSVAIDENLKKYEATKGNVTEVWHGTSIANVLSILKSGLKVSPPSTAAIAGKMFGNGIYGSQTSSKSMGYTFGRWGQGFNNTGYLFVLDFVMGKPYYPTTYGINSIPSGYDSCWALPDKTGLCNDELIVYSEKQFKIKYLLEVEQ
jgi:poly [ADP-ribose] polymerase 2/3/4